MKDSEPTLIQNELLQGEGFTKVSSLIDANQADHIRELLLARVANARENEPGVIHMTDLICLGPEFEALVTNPRLLSIAHALLGEDATLGAFSARILMPGCVLGGLHIDYPYWAMPNGMPVSPPLMMQVIWMMEPFTSDNGGTWVLPNSQHESTWPDEEKFNKQAHQVSGEAGDALVSHGLLWHRTAQNHSDKPRVAVLINYTALTIRPMVPLGPFDDAFKDSASPQLRALLGFDHSAALRQRILNR